VFISMFGYAQDSYKHSINGEYVAHSRYSLSYLEKHEQAEWVCYSLNYNLLRGNTNIQSDRNPRLIIYNFD
jgi:hypothetical protein